MLNRFKDSSVGAKIGYVSVIIAVLLGLSSIGDKVWGLVYSVDARYAKQVDLDDTNLEVAAVQRQLKSNRFLQLEKQLFEMRMRWGADMSKWTESQRALYFQLKAEYDRLGEQLGKK